MTSEGRRGLPWALGSSALAAAGFCFLYAYVELRFNARAQTHVHRWPDLLLVFRYHLPLFFVLGLVGGVLGQWSGRKRQAGAPPPAILGGLLFAAWLLGATVSDFLVVGRGVPALPGALAAIAVGGGFAAGAWRLLGLLGGGSARRAWIPWALALGAVLVGVALVRWTTGNDLGFFDPRSLLRTSSGAVAGLGLLLVLGALCRRPGPLWAAVLVLSLVDASTWMDRSRPERVERSAPEGRPNVILILIDTLRADYMSVYGYDEDTTPHLRELAESGIVFENCVAASNWTKPSTASLFTSLEPSVHGVVDEASRMPEELLTAAEVFQAAGYTTIGLVANHHLRSMFGFDQGFDVFRDPQSSGMSRLTIVGRSIFARYLDRVDGWFPTDRTHHVGLRAEDLRTEGIRQVRAIEEPFFLYLHFMDPHSPYDPPDAYEAVFNPDLSQRYTLDDVERDPGNVPESGVREMERRYLGEILYTDAMLGGLFDDLRRLELKRPVTVAITADHGEAFGDHGDYGHGHSLYEEQVRVPFLLWGPGVPEGQRWIEPVSLLDIVPTIVELAGLELPAEFRGRSLTAGFDDPVQSRQREFVLAEKVGQYAALRGAGWKYIENRPEIARKLRTPDIAHRAVQEYYDLVQDPQETASVLEPGRAADLSGRLQSLLGILGHLAVERDTLEMDEETRRQLKALGYL